MVSVEHNEDYVLIITVVRTSHIAYAMETEVRLDMST
jgi:hypothetical protein